MGIGEFIHRQRIRRGLTQIDLGKLLNVANTTISNYEKEISTPDLHTFIRLANIFHANYVPLIALCRNAVQNCELYEKAYTEFFRTTKDIPDARLSVISANPAWKCRKLLSSDKCFVVIDNHPKELNQNAAVIASVPKGEEHIYRIRYCGESMYLSPESGPSYLTPVKIHKESVPLKKILAIIQYP